MITLSNTFGLNSNLYTPCALLKYIIPRGLNISMICHRR